MNYLGIDPGVNGGAVCVTADLETSKVRVLKFKEGGTA